MTIATKSVPAAPAVLAREARVRCGAPVLKDQGARAVPVPVPNKAGRIVDPTVCNKVRVQPNVRPFWRSSIVITTEF
jgi:hypothetical protein